MKRSVRVSAVGDRDDGSILLCKFENLPFWMLPGGKAEPGETIDAALRRELREEASLEIEVSAFLGVIENHFQVSSDASLELGLYFRVAYPEAIGNVDSFAGTESGLRFHWHRASSLPDIDLRPGLLRQLLRYPLQPFGFRTWED